MRSSIGSGGGGFASVLVRGFDRDEENRCGLTFIYMSKKIYMSQKWSVAGLTGWNPEPNKGICKVNKCAMLCTYLCFVADSMSMIVDS